MAREPWTDPAIRDNDPRYRAAVTREATERLAAEEQAVIDAGLTPLHFVGGVGPDYGTDPDTARRAAEFDRAHHPPVDDPPWSTATFEDVTITPELAAAWLRIARSVEGPNRPLVVDAYTDLMARGEWVDQTLAGGRFRRPVANEIVNEPVTFDEDGHVRYGLQRLAAVVRSGATIRQVVARFPRTTNDLSVSARTV